MNSGSHNGAVNSTHLKLGLYAVRHIFGVRTLQFIDYYYITSFLYDIIFEISL